MGESYQTYKEELMSSLLKLFQKIGGESASKLTLQGQYCPVYKISQKLKKKLPIALRNIDAKILNKIVATLIQQYVKRIIYQDLL